MGQKDFFEDVVGVNLRAANQRFYAAAEAEIKRWLDEGYVLDDLVMEFVEGDPEVEKMPQQEGKIIRRFRVREKSEEEKKRLT